MGKKFIVKKNFGSPRPDYFGLRVKFVCGAIAGIFLGFRFGFISLTNNWLQSIIMGVIFALIFGGLSSRFGDKFWHFLIK